MLMRPGHVKGHQDVNGKVIDGGSYQSNFWPDKFVSKWHEILKQDLEQINTELQNRKRIEGKDEEPLAAVLHQSNTVQFYSDLGPASHYISHSACFSCLVRELPEHPLPYVPGVWTPMELRTHQARLLWKNALSIPRNRNGQSHGKLE